MHIFALSAFIEVHLMSDKKLTFLRGKMRLSKFQVFLLTYYVCVLLIPLSESAGSISPGLQHTQNFPVQNVITALRLNIAKKILGIPQIGSLVTGNKQALSIPLLNMSPDDIRQALSLHPNFENLTGHRSAPMPKTDLQRNHNFNPLVPSQQKDWSAVEHPTYPPQPQLHDFAKILGQLGWNPEPEQSPYLHLKALQSHNFGKGLGWNNIIGKYPTLTDNSKGHVWNAEPQNSPSLDLKALQSHDFPKGHGMKADPEKYPYLNLIGLHLHNSAKNLGWRPHPEKSHYLHVAALPLHDHANNGNGWNSMPGKPPYFDVKAPNSPVFAEGYGYDISQGHGWNGAPQKSPVSHGFEKGLGWALPQPYYSHYHHHHHFIKLPKPKNMCEDLARVRVVSLADLRPNWRTVRVVNATERDEVDPASLLVPPLVPVPEVPLQYNDNTLDELDQTYFEEISIDFDSRARKTGLSITRNKFSSNPESSKNSNSNPLLSLEESDNILRGVVIIVKSRKPSTPLRGKFDMRGEFQIGLTNSKQARERGETAPPVGRFFRQDLLYATELFERILDFEGDEEYDELFGESDKDNQLEENWMEMPTLVGFVEKRSYPDIDHSERTVLDAEFNFGLPASSFEFQRVETTIQQWKDMRNRRRSRRRMERTDEVSNSFGGFGGFIESSEEFVRSRMKLHRTFLRESYIEAEEVVQTEYVVQQFLICPTREGPCGDCPLDPILAPSRRVDWRAGSGGPMRMRRRPNML